MTFDDFRNYCKDDVNRIFDQLDAERLQCKANYKSFVLTMIVLGAGLTLVEIVVGSMTALRMNRLATPGLFIFLILVGIPVLYALQFRRFEKVKEHFRLILFPMVLGTVLPEWAWSRVATETMKDRLSFPYKQTSCHYTFLGSGPSGSLSFCTSAILGHESLKSGLFVTTQHPWNLQDAVTFEPNRESVAQINSASPGDAFQKYFNVKGHITELSKLSEAVKVSILNFSMDLELMHLGPVHWHISPGTISIFITFNESTFDPEFQEMINSEPFYMKLFDRLNLVEAFRRSLLTQ